MRKNNDRHISRIFNASATRLIFSFFIMISALWHPIKRERNIPCNSRTHVAFFRNSQWICGRCGKIVDALK